MRYLTWALLLTAAAATSAHAKAVLSQETWLCAIGQFASADGGQTVEINNGAIGLGDTCPTTPAKVKATKKHTVLTARWKGCEGYKGPVRVAAKLAAGSCDVVDVRVRAKKANRRFRALRSKGDPSDCRAADATFDQIQRRIFGAKGCRVETCHGSAKSGGLDLRMEPPTTRSSAPPPPARRVRFRVAPGDSAKSFLVRKLAGVLQAGEGDRHAERRPPGARARARLDSRMDRRRRTRYRRPDRCALPAAASFRGSEAAAAPARRLSDRVRGTDAGSPARRSKAASGSKRRTPRTSSSGSWEYSLNPGTHHFAIWEHRPEAAMPALHHWTKDTACIEGGARFGISISGAGEAPYFVEEYQGNLGKLVKGGSILGINPHYFNEFDVPIQVKLWINLHPARAERDVARQPRLARRVAGRQVAATTSSCHRTRSARCDCAGRTTPPRR